MREAFDRIWCRLPVVLTVARKTRPMTATNPITQSH